MILILATITGTSMFIDRRRSHPDGHRVTVLGSFTVTADGGPGGPPTVDARRVVAYLAVHRRPQRRADLAADLWPGVPEAARLLDDAVADLLAVGLLVDRDDDGRGAPVALHPDVRVDLDEAMSLVRTLTETSGRPAPVPADLSRARALLAADILPGDPAPWLTVERERFRQIRLNAVEELSAALSARGRHAEAVSVAYGAVRAAPSRETARRALIEAHLAQGDIAEAVAAYDEYQELLRCSVGAPSTGPDGGAGLPGLLPPVPAWPVLRVRRSTQRIGMSPPGLRLTRPARRLVAGGSVPGAGR
jgi:DNA-binding SARP family transcriptional activator